MPRATFDRITAGNGIALAILGLSTFAIACPAADAYASGIRRYPRCQERR